MDKVAGSTNMLDLLNQALARELQVCLQYMLQHGIGAGRASAVTGKGSLDAQDKFVASHSQVWLPGATLKKIAVTEMHHAESITERIVHLGGVPTTQPDAITLGQATREMLAIDRHEEQGAIELYRQIIDVAAKAHDDETLSLFRGILADEEKHLRTFSDLLAKE